MQNEKINNKIAGSFLASAIGDGFGYPTEFLKYNEIIDRWGINGLTEPVGNPIKVTDDTQMALAVGKAIMKSYDNRTLKPQTFEEALRKEFVVWLNDPQNNRAPGMTCLKSCENLAKGMPWQKATSLNSKGCGANMRVLPIALLKFKDETITDESIGKWAQFQAAMTHAHPTALAASELTALTVVKLIEGMNPDLLLEYLLDYCSTQKNKYHHGFLDKIWQRPSIESPEMYINRGWEECEAVLRKVETAVKRNDKVTDPCVYTGEGWIAEEAFATALLCFLYYPNDTTATLRRAVNTSGDSDSLACIAGSFAGAYNGLYSIPQDWVNRVEYKDELDEFIKFVTTE